MDSRNLLSAGRVCHSLLIGLAVLAGSTAGYANPMDGVYLENPLMLDPGMWDMRMGVDFGSGAEPIEGPFLSASSKNPIEVDYVKIPVEVRYGLSPRSEIGWLAAVELDKGQKITTGNVTGTFLDAGGLQNMRLSGKWKFRRRIAWAVDLSFAGNNTLMGGSDGLELGVRWISAARLGGGDILFNAGLIAKSGGADLNDNGVSSGAENYKNQILFGIGYVHPWTSRLNWSVELSGATSPFAAGSGFSSNDMLSMVIGSRFAVTDRFHLLTGLGLGIFSGSPAFQFRLGMNSMLGGRPAIGSVGPRVSGGDSADESDFWSPTKEDQERLVRTIQEASPSARPKSKEEDLAAKIAMADESFGKGDYLRAISYYEAAIYLKDNDPALHYNLATSYFMRRRYYEAKRSYGRAIQLSPGDIDSHLYLGYTYYYLNDPAQAGLEWRKVLDLDPGHALARGNLESLGLQQPQ